MERSACPPPNTYLSLVGELSPRYPTLGYLTSFIQRQREHGSSNQFPIVCSVLEFDENGVKHINFSSYCLKTDIQGRTLEKYLSSQPATPTRRLYMLEDLSEPYIELFGSYLGVDAQVFAAHIQDSHWSEDDQMGHPPQLLSANGHEKSFRLRYYETRVFDNPPLDPVPSMVRTAAYVSRNVTFQHEVTKGGKNHVWCDGPVATILRNVSFWCRTEEDGGWNGRYTTILIDLCMSLVLNCSFSSASSGSSYSR
jgi:hypothetical protein